MLQRRTKTRALGQHFLEDRKILTRIVDASSICNNETVCEAGTGNGIITAELCKLARKVVSFEIDRALFEKARDRLPFSNLQLVNGDLFSKKDLEFDVFVSNLPYSRSRDAFQWLLTRKFSRGILMVQKEFAEKLTARPGDRNYRAISALASYCFTIEKLFQVERNSFDPPPLVESEVIKIVSARTATPDNIRKVNLLFSRRNKKATSLAKMAGLKMDFGDKRVDHLAPAEIILLARSM